MHDGKKRTVYDVEWDIWIINRWLNTISIAKKINKKNIDDILISQQEKIKKRWKKMPEETNDILKLSYSSEIYTENFRKSSKNKDKMIS